MSIEAWWKYVRDLHNRYHHTRQWYTGAYIRYVQQLTISQRAKREQWWTNPSSIFQFCKNDSECVHTRKMQMESAKRDRKWIFLNDYKHSKIIFIHSQLARLLARSSSIAKSNCIACCQKIDISILHSCDSWQGRTLFI